ncbi:hypothetical protein GCM10027051_27890 [Niabella terrae]
MTIYQDSTFEFTLTGIRADKNQIDIDNPKSIEQFLPKTGSLDNFVSATGSLDFFTKHQHLVSLYHKESQ